MHDRQTLTRVRRSTGESLRELAHFDAGSVLESHTPDPTCWTCQLRLVSIVVDDYGFCLLVGEGDTQETRWNVPFM